MKTMPMPRLLLLAGLLAGMVGTGISVVRQVPAAGLPSGAMAQVGERLILRDEWLKGVAAAASERRTPLTTAQQTQILDRLIDEELLVQHGLSLGLVEHDQRLRGQLIAEVLFSTTASLSDDAIAEAELESFYRANVGLFVPPAQLRVQAWTLGSAGERKAFFPPLPNSLLPLHKLQQYLGPELVKAAMLLPLGQESRPIANQGQQVILLVSEQQLAPAPALEAVREPVLRELRRQRDERAVRELLDDLRQQYRVTRVDPQ